MRLILLTAVTTLTSLATYGQQQCVPGIYQRAGLSPSFFSVHVSGNAAIAISLDFNPNSSGTSFNYSGLGTARPSQLQVWEYVHGTFNGQTYDASGTEFKGACFATYEVSCDGLGGMTATVKTAQQTPAGTSWNFNCAAALSALVQTGQNVMNFRKVF